MAKKSWKTLIFPDEKIIQKNCKKSKEKSLKTQFCHKMILKIFKKVQKKGRNWRKSLGKM